MAVATRTEATMATRLPSAVVATTTMTRSPSTAVATPTESTTATKPPSKAVAKCTADMTASTALIIPVGTHTTDMTQMMVDITAFNNTSGKIDDVNESFLYYHLFDGDSSHGPINHASLSGTLFPSQCEQ